MTLTAALILAAAILLIGVVCGVMQGWAKPKETPSIRVGRWTHREDQ